MREDQRVHAVLEVVGGEALEVVAARHEVSVEELSAWRALYVAGLRQAARASTRRSRVRGRTLLAAALLVVLLPGTWAVAQVTCTQSLPAPLVTFCPDAPALAGDVNGNLQTLVNWLQQKVGPVGNANVAVGGTLGVTGPTTLGALTATSATVTGSLASGRWHPSYQNWGGPVGAGGAAIANDNSSTYQALMVVGNDSGGGNVRRVHLFDDVKVDRNLRVNGNITFADPHTIAHTREPARQTSWGTWGGMSMCDANTFVCGMELLSEGNQGGGDDSAVNGVRFACCPLGQ